jgi:hypothetical protein
VERHLRAQKGRLGSTRKSQQDSNRRTISHQEIAGAWKGALEGRLGFFSEDTGPAVGDASRSQGTAMLESGVEGAALGNRDGRAADSALNRWETS